MIVCFKLTNFVEFVCRGMYPFVVGTDWILHVGETKKEKQRE